MPGANVRELPEVGAVRNSDPQYESESRGNVQGTSQRRERANMAALKEQETHAKPKALGESYAMSHQDPPQCQEVAGRNEAEEAPEGVKRANALR